MITQQKQNSPKFDKELRKYDSPFANIPPLKVNTVTISSKINLVNSSFLDFQEKFPQKFHVCRQFHEILLIWKWK